MSLRASLRELNATQRHVVLASFLGWTLDAFDFFLLVFVLGDIARDFDVRKTAVTFVAGAGGARDRLRQGALLST